MQYAHLIINITTPNYSSWRITDLQGREVIDHAMATVDPTADKLFTEDVFYMDPITAKPVLVDSPNRTRILPAVLIMNKTYGRLPSNGKLIYKCVPNNKYLPHFLVPYEMKQVGFSKNINNLFVLILFTNWFASHPIGTIHQTIGSVDVIEHFYEYKLYCRNLHVSVCQLTTNFFKRINSYEINNHTDVLIHRHNVENRCGKEWNIFTIDNKNTNTYDDAISIRHDSDVMQTISVYISNVSIWIDYFDLWELLSPRVATIYLPNKKMGMIPSFFVNEYLTLEKDKQRIAFCMDLSVCNDTIMDVSFKNVIINVSQNYTYEDKKLLKKREYKSLFNKVQSLVDNKKNIASTMKMNVLTSRDLVEYLMITMNYQVALFTRKYSAGIYKAIPQPNLREYSEEFIQNPKMMEYMKRGKFGQSKYITFAEVDDGESEQGLYLPITSPIRKLVDLINLTITQQLNNVVVVSHDATEFCNTWSEKLDIITLDTKETKHLEYECKLLKTCSDNLANEYEGIIVDILTENEVIKYTIYLPELEVSLRMKSMKTDAFDPNKCLLGSSNRYKLYLFEKETTLVKKIRLALKT
jgi:hypothetical protein